MFYASSSVSSLQPVFSLLYSVYPAILNVYILISGCCCRHVFNVAFGPGGIVKYFWLPVGHGACTGSKQDVVFIELELNPHPKICDL